MVSTVRIYSLFVRYAAILSLRWTKAASACYLIAAAILASRKLAQFDRVQMVPAGVSAIANAVRWAEEIMKAIDQRWPA